MRTICAVSEDVYFAAPGAADTDYVRAGAHRALQRCAGVLHPLSEAGVIHNLSAQPSVNPVDRLIQSASGVVKPMSGGFMNTA